MEILPPALARLINNLATLPGVGNKTATRLALHILRGQQGAALELADSLSNLHESIQLCSSCFAFSETDPCSICADPGRNSEILCVIEQPADLLAIEATRSFKGHYHILHGTLSPVDGIGPDEIKIRELVHRSNNGVVKEVLIATSSTVPGEATASYLIDTLKNSHLRVTRLAYGIPMGMDIKHADKHTLARAIQGRDKAT